MNLNYTQAGNYLNPDLEEPNQNQQVGKYGKLRRIFLREHNPGHYNHLLSSGQLMQHLQEMDERAQQLVTQSVNEMLEKNPPPDKNSDPLGWIGHMNNLKHKAEEIVLPEVIYSN